MGHTNYYAGSYRSLPALALMDFCFATTQVDQRHMGRWKTLTIKVFDRIFFSRRPFQYFLKWLLRSYYKVHTAGLLLNQGTHFTTLFMFVYTTLYCRWVFWTWRDNICKTDQASFYYTAFQYRQVARGWGGGRGEWEEESIGKKRKVRDALWMSNVKASAQSDKCNSTFFKSFLGARLRRQATKDGTF